MPNPENIIPHQFKKGVSGNPKGRPPSRVPKQLVTILGKAQARKFYSLSASEVKEWDAAILTFNTNQLQLLAKWDEAPAYPKGLAIALLVDMKNGKTNTLDKLRERVHGKEIQRIELTGKDGAALIEPRTLTKEEARALFEELQEKY